MVRVGACRAHAPPSPSSLLRDSNYLLGLNAFAMFYLGALLFVSLYGGQVRKYNLWDFVAFPVVDAIIAITNGGAIFGQFKTYKGKSWARVALGMVLALVLLLILARCLRRPTRCSGFD